MRVGGLGSNCGTVTVRADPLYFDLLIIVKTLLWPNANEIPLIVIREVLLLHVMESFLISNRSLPVLLTVTD